MYKTGSAQIKLKKIKKTETVKLRDHRKTSAIPSQIKKVNLVRLEATTKGMRLNINFELILTFDSTKTTTMNTSTSSESLVFTNIHRTIVPEEIKQIEIPTPIYGNFLLLAK
jgi:hypothetical protein